MSSGFADCHPGKLSSISRATNVQVPGYQPHTLSEIVRAIAPSLKGMGPVHCPNFGARTASLLVLTRSLVERTRDYFRWSTICDNTGTILTDEEPKCTFKINHPVARAGSRTPHATCMCPGPFNLTAAPPSL